MNYIYVFEDGRIGYSTTSPTEIDLVCVRQGLLQVLRVPRGVVWDIYPDGSERPLEECQIHQDPNNCQYHEL